jgi:thymidylate synthase
VEKNLKQYLDALQYIVDNGEKREDRTGVGTRSVFGYQMRFDLSEGFPAVTTKKLAWRAVVGELLWFIEGSTDERRLAEITYEKSRTLLHDRNTIWTANADNQAKALGYANSVHGKELGPVYGKQWRNFGGVDQLEEIVHQLKYDQDSRRIIMSAWNPVDLPHMALPPCHTLSQFYVNDGKLSCQLYQRSADMFLGVPFNIASYSLLTHILAEICDLEVAHFVWTGGDIHIYSNHEDVVREQLQRKPRKLPQLRMPKIDSLSEVSELCTSDFELINYDPMESLKAPMAV